MCCNLRQELLIEVQTDSASNPMSPPLSYPKGRLENEKKKKKHVIMLVNAIFSLSLYSSSLSYSNST